MSNSILDAVMPKTVSQSKTAIKATMVKAKAATPQVDSNVAALNGKSYATLASECGNMLARASKMEVEAAELKSQVNDSIKVLHAHGVKIGRKNKCPIAESFHSALIDGGMAKGTADNYLMMFKEHVQSGKPITDWNKSRKLANSKKGETKQRVPKSFAALLIGAFNHAEGKTFKDLCLEIEHGFEAVKYESVYEGFLHFLEFSGEVEIEEVE